MEDLNGTGGQTGRSAAESPRTASTNNIDLGLRGLRRHLTNLSARRFPPNSLQELIAVRLFRFFGTDTIEVRQNMTRAGVPSETIEGVVATVSLIFLQQQLNESLRIVRRIANAMKSSNDLP